MMCNHYFLAMPMDEVVLDNIMYDDGTQTILFLAIFHSITRYFLHATINSY